MNYYIKRTELYHYGIQGQKWGIRNGPPYPLGSDDYSAREKQVKESGGSSKINKEAIKKVLKIAAISAVAAGSIYVGYKSYDILHGRMLSTGIREKALTYLRSQKYRDKLVSEIDSLDDYDQIDNFRVVNNTVSGPKLLHKAAENYDSLTDMQRASISADLKDGRLTNCGYCTTSACLRRMGYDCAAGTTTKGMTSGQVITYWKGATVNDFAGNSFGSMKESLKYNFDSVKSRKSVGLKEINDTFAKLPNGSFGDLHVHNQSMMGHSIEWFKNDSGSVQIFDNQIKMKFDSIDEYFSANPKWVPNFSEYIRLDNATPNIALMVKDGIITKPNIF